ncbi:uncharacterized protein LOC132712715 [Ruditapes philippinarum]|uniref:uncharacterized protein LOC132712715 n=1 Tax=Ruditapes philippinarum TaxID=129788 RepID=UPI00295AC497|nr:uncharacterized protein LOC132712715 [Ruditapes philippinarum]
MDNNISVDAVGISPRHQEDQTNSHPQTFQDRDSFPIKDQQEQNNYLPPDTRNITYSPEQHGYYQPQSKNDSEAINITQVRHEEEVKDLVDVDIAHAKKETEIKTPQSDLSMPETQETQLPGVGNYDNQNRQVHTGNQHKELCLPPSPPLDWRLNELLDYIATNVDDTELKRIKLMFTGPNGIGKGVLEKCDSCLQLFIVLKQRGYISRDNILYMNKILYVLERRDLHQKTVEYCVNEGDVIHYYSVDRLLDVGEKQIKIHVKADVQNYNKEQLDRLRNVVASIACIPAEEILISAVAPGSSLLITFTMPEMYVDILQSLFEKKVNLRRFTAIDVDIIIIDGKQYDVTGQEAVIDVSEQCKELMNVYKQLEKTRNDLEEMEITNLNCKKELEEVTDRLKKAESTRNSVVTLESRNSELVTLCSMLQSMHFTYGVTESSIEKLRLLMTEATNKDQDKELIQRIIRANTEIVAACHRNRNELEQKERSIKDEKKKFIEFELKRDLATGIRTAKEVLVEHFNVFLRGFDLGMKMELVEAMYKTSEKISSEQKAKLRVVYELSKDDVINACIDADEGLILLGIECKESIAENKPNTSDDILARCGQTIGLDLLSLYNTFVQEVKEEKKQQEKIQIHKQLIRHLEHKSKTPQEIVIMFAETLTFKQGAFQQTKIDPSSIANIVQKFKGLYMLLTESEREELSSMLVSEDVDAISKSIELDKSLLISGLMFQKMESLEKFINPEKFVIEIQERLKRKDLLRLCQELKEDEDEQLKQIKNYEEKRLKETILLQDLKSNRNTAEDVLLQKLTYFTFKLVESADINAGSFFPKLTKLLRDISSQFTEAECSRLVRKMQWGDNDVIRECIRANRSLLIQGLWQKEIENLQGVPNIDTFISTICKEVGRIDIYNQFEESGLFLLIDDKFVNHVFEKAVGYFGSQPYVGIHEKQPFADEAGATCASGNKSSLGSTSLGTSY